MERQLPNKYNESAIYAEDEKSFHWNLWLESWNIKRKKKEKLNITI